jgi:Cu/Ag efflux protein CusF
MAAIVSALTIGTVSAAETLVAKPGRVVTAMVKSGAIVEAVNKETREVKLIDPRGHRFTVVADDLVRNFDQIEPRDRVVVEYLESVALVVAPAGSEPPIEDAIAMNVAPAGDKPGVEGVETHLVVATVQAINSADRLVTLETEEGDLSTIKVAEDAKLNMVDVGDQVRLRVTRAVAVSVVKPDAG